MASPTSDIIDTIASRCLAVRARALDRAVSAVYDEELRPLGVRTSQLNVLVVAGKLGVARPREVCRILCMDTSTLSRNVERMRERGWLETVTDDDARAQPFRLSASGRRLIREAVPAWERAQRRVHEMLGADGVQGLQRASACVLRTGT